MRPLASVLLGVAGLVCASGGARATSPPVTAPAPTALRVPGPLSPRNASYQIRARLDEKTHTVTGTLTLAWRNLERAPAERLVFHLYYNAFKNAASTFIREVGPQLRGDEMPDDGYGYIDVGSLRVNGQDLTKNAKIDDTLMSVPLAAPIGPSAAAQVEIAFTSRLPKVFARAGYDGDFHAITQWFPKIGVFECAGQGGAPGAGTADCRWRAHQYHGNTEFFSDYGVYDVELDAPRAAVVGGSGVLVGTEDRGDRRLWRFHAEDVHDFALISDPAFIEVNDEVRDEWGRVRLRLLTRKGSLGMTARHLHATREGLLELERRFGVYPYDNVTVVVPPADADGAAGMEYPTLFLTVGGDFPAGIRAVDETTIHELGHQYFYGLVGSDEVEEAWLDEGLNETFTTWGMERVFGQKCTVIDFAGLCMNAIDMEWAGYRGTRRQRPLSTPSFTLLSSNYPSLSYSQTAVTMRTLERYLGPERTLAAFRRHVDRGRFRHPRRADFVAAVSEGAGEDLRWFFDQALTTTRVADYTILSAKTHKHELAGGNYDCPPTPLAPVPGFIDSPTAADPEAVALYNESAAAACEGGKTGRQHLDPDHYEAEVRKRAGMAAKTSKVYDSDVIVQRRGDFVFPVHVRLTFEDASKQELDWTRAEQEAAPEDRLKRVQVFRRARLVQAEVDPEGVLLLDEKRLNNGLRTDGRGRPGWLAWLSWQGLLQALVDWVGV